MLDSRISMDLAFMLHNMMQVISVVIAGIFVSPFMIIFAMALLATCLYFALRYLAGAREVKRLESNAKSPIFEQFGSVLMGIGTIRAFDKTDAYLDKMYKRIDTHCRAYWHLNLFNRWMGFRLNMVGALFAGITAALIVSITSIDSSLAGFALSFALGLSESVIWFLRQYSNVELDMNATERIVEYSNITTESQGGSDAPAAWPTEGTLEVNDLVVSYAPDLPPVLKGLTFSISRNQRVGVVGRTGAGKSSLTLALFRFLEATSGSITIDGVDISKIKLFDLRSRLAIIPQDPVLFSGTVRSNLDAFDQHTDAELRDALARVHLIDSPSTSSSSLPSSSSSSTAIDPNSTPTNKNINIFTSLQSRITESGTNLSQGQRQLLCLARAIVSRPKIMVLDEATSAVDMETDALIQRSIREEFTDSTLIVIAHRLSTIADFDRILVLGEGRVVEYGEPSVLMAKEGGVFREMVEASGERGVVEGAVYGKKEGQES
jgi:ABC-type multidrug transport system fused ATPase/permease subunit